MNHPIIGVLALWFAARALGTLSVMLRQPAIVGELLAGMLFSPVFLGHRYPVASPLLSELTLYSGILFLFFAGFEIQFSTVFGKLRAGITVGIANTLVPLALGWLVVTRAPELLGIDGTISPSLGLFLGLALGITALPLLVRSLLDTGLYFSPIGSVALSAALLNDLLVWLAFSLLLAAVPLEGVNWVRFHLPVLAFLLGTFVGDRLRTESGSVKRSASWLANRALAPLFFGTVGLKLGNFSHFDFRLTLILLGLAFVGKVIPSLFAARLSGVPKREAWAVAFALNSRGGLGVMFCTLGREAGIIGDRLYFSLVLVAVLTSMLAAPAMRQIVRPENAV